MDEETKVTAQEAPEVPKTETPEETKDAEQAKTDTPSSSEMDVEKTETGEEEGDEATSSKTDNDMKAESTKMSKLEKENNELRQAKQYLDALDSAAANDPDFMKMANKKLVEQGVLPESVLEQMEQPQSGAETGVEPIASTDGLNSNPVIQWAQNKKREEEEKLTKFFNNFEDQRQDLVDEDPKVTKANRGAITAAAQRLIAKGTPMEEAYGTAYNQIFHPEKLVEKGELQGMAKAQAATPTEQSASGGSANSSGTVTLTPEQKEAARLFGVSEEAYAKRLEE